MLTQNKVGKGRRREGGSLEKKREPISAMRGEVAKREIDRRVTLKKKQEKNWGENRLQQESRKKLVIRRKRRKEREACQGA